MRRGAWAADLAALHAAAWHGVIRAGELARLGVPVETVYRRCRDGGPWQRLLPGIVLLANGIPGRLQLSVAALLYGGADAMLTGLEACRRHGVRRGPSPASDLHLLVPHSRQLRASGFVQVERTRRLPAPVVRAGIPLAPLPRACIDAARRLRDGREITELLADPIQRGFCSVADLASELDAAPRRGTATPRAVLAAVGAGARSAAERDAQRVWRRSGLPEPWWNTRVFDAHGRLLGVADAWFDDVALAWEINSVEFHLSPHDYAYTTERAARFSAAGAIVLPTLPSRLNRDESGVITEFRGTYASAAQRPRPPLHAVRATA